VGSKFNSEKLDRVVVWQLLFHGDQPLRH
jgi:hypothetical protein